MEKIILIIIKALGALGETGIHWVLAFIETKIVESSTEVDNELLYTVLKGIKSYVPKNPIE